ncbi:MAG: glycoside hydrolase family 9 protein [Sphingopyxis sp.]|uniref:glycoside hydrolase family 9 protein n=1 Tax=Sphingopyxis sp. TaxID=1908224 RepID=UPI001A3BB8F6|nr:glycoside hydrolase family 9 protein [Sphingopyxis sp.]MBL9067297.1 glycoside hydrolase family 9 protein [Sphingopyxis sp.]
MSGVKHCLGAAIAIGAALGWASPAAADSLKLHVNQVALERTGSKTAIVEYEGLAEAGGFTLLRDGKSVATGELARLPEFTEWGVGKRYFAADFSHVREPGAYAIEVSIGKTSARSPAFVLADGALFSVTGQALVDYFRLSRHTDPADRNIRVHGGNRFVDVWGGWKDAGGDNGKYLSHLSYANFFNPQQTGFAAWALAKSYDLAPAKFREHGAEYAVIAEALWGADFLHRLLAPEGYFYMTVFDRWGTPGAERVLTAYTGRDGVYSDDYPAAFREGAGAAIAALARIARLSREKGVKGVFTADQYLADAERAFAHLQANNLSYADDGKENIIDDYGALLAATELFESTGKAVYLEAARGRAAALNGRLTDRGWFRSDDSDRPFYHGAEAGLPVVALVAYLAIENDPARSAAAKATIARVLAAQLKLDASVANPFAYPRQSFQLYDFKTKQRDPRVREGFFMPHANETGYWWQGESARLASLSVAAVLGGRATAPQPGKTFGVAPELAAFAQAQIDWTLGRNPYDLSMVYGFGAKNPPHAESAGAMVRGGVSNGITGSDASDEGRGITFAPGPDSENWRWIEQWIPHTAWLLLLASATAGDDAGASAN